MTENKTFFLKAMDTLGTSKHLANSFSMVHSDSS